MQSYEPFEVMAVLEADDALLGEACPYTAMPLWLRVRELVYFSCGQMTYSIPPLAALTPTLGVKERLKQALATMTNILGPRGQAALFMPSAGVFKLGQRGPVAVGVGKLVCEDPKRCSLLLNTDAMSLENLPLAWRYPKAYFSHADMVQTQAIDRSAVLQTRFDLAFERLSTLVDSRLQAGLGTRLSSRIWSAIKTYLNAAGQRFQGSVESWHTLLSRHNPKCIVLEDGPYLARQPIVAAARALGIQSADLQHGSVISTHTIYNLGPGVVKSDRLPDIFPDCFLARGSHWAKETNLPWRSVILGHPDRPDTVQKPQADLPPTVLVIGQLPNAYFQDLATALSRVLPDSFHVIFRPHPSQRTVDQSGLPISERLRLDRGRSLFEALTEASHLVGEHSTVVFEALGIVPNIYVRKTRATEAILDNFPLVSFNMVDDLAEKIKCGAPTDIDPDQFWAPNWQSRLDAFLSEL